MKLLIQNIIFRIILSGIFFVIGGFSIYHIKIFSERIYEYLPYSWQFSAVLSRILIGLLLVFAFIIVYRRISDFTKWVSFTILAYFVLDYFVFSSFMVSMPLLQMFAPYIVFILTVSGSVVLLLLPESEALLKPKWIYIIPLISSFLWVYFSNPLDGKQFKLSKSALPMEKFPVKTLERYDSLDIIQDKDVLVAFLSTTCVHCMEKARRFCITFGNKPKEIKCIFGSYNTDESMAHFFKKNGSINLKYQYLDQDEYLSMVGSHLPTIYRFKNGAPVEHYSGEDINLAALDYFKEIYYSN